MRFSQLALLNLYLHQRFQSFACLANWIALIIKFSLNEGYKLLISNTIKENRADVGNNSNKGTKL